MSENAPLQNQLNKLAGKRRPGVEFERPQVTGKAVRRKYRTDEIELKGKKAGVIADEILPTIERSRRKELATLRLIVLAIVV